MFRTFNKNNLFISLIRTVLCVTSMCQRAVTDRSLEISVWNKTDHSELQKLYS